MEICKFEVLQVGMNHERSSALIFPLSAISSSPAMNYEPSTMNSPHALVFPLSDLLRP